MRESIDWKNEMDSFALNVEFINGFVNICVQAFNSVIISCTIDVQAFNSENIVENLQTEKLSAEWCQLWKQFCIIMSIMAFTYSQ